MSVCELNRNYDTLFTLFSVESEDDLRYLPTAVSCGSGKYTFLKPCCQGSKAQCIDGTVYVLNSKNEWIIMANNPIESNAIHIVRGSSKTFKIALSVVGEDSYTPDQSNIVKFGVKKNMDDTTMVIEKELTYSDYSDGGYELSLSPEDTASLDVGKYYYDIGLQSGNDYYIVVQCSLFMIEQNITEGDD